MKDFENNYNKIRSDETYYIVSTNENKALLAGSLLLKHKFFNFKLIKGGF